MKVVISLLVSVSVATDIGLSDQTSINNITGHSSSYLEQQTNMSEDEQHERAFGVRSDMSEHCRNEINLIRSNNENHVNEFVLDPDDAVEFTDLAWELLGRYIARNTHLEEVFLNNCGITDRKMALLFSGLVRSVSLKRFLVSKNEFGIDGVRCMMSFLQNSPNLSLLYLSQNSRINSECFEVLVSALDGKSIKVLSFSGCNIGDISALDRYNLPCLHTLHLNRNSIGREGCITLSNLLQQEGSTLTTLYLSDTDMGDEEAEIIASSLKQNTKLEELNLLENNITNRGCLAFLKLLNDISSIDNTYKSNHTLQTINIAEYVTSDLLDSISEACIENRRGSNANSIGRLKVIRTQLNSQERKKICKLQGIEYLSIGNLFADIEPSLLPNILALIGEIHGQSELYTALVPTAPDLLSYIDRKALIKDVLAKNQAQMSLLAAHNRELIQRLASLDKGDSKQLAVAKDKEVVLSGKKRGRSQDSKMT